MYEHTYEKKYESNNNIRIAKVKFTNLEKKNIAHYVSIFLLDCFLSYFNDIFFARILHCRSWREMLAV